MVNETVTFTANGTEAPICHASTDADGVAECSDPAAQVQALTESAGIHATFDGTRTHEASEDTAPWIALPLQPPS